MNRSAVLYALLSAALFGAATPATKVLLGSVAPFLAAGLLYCGAGIGAALLRSAGRFLPGGRLEAEKAQLARTELPWLGSAIAAGGIVGPALLMIGLARTEASTSSLLLTLEGAATTVLAWFVFGENFDRRIALGMFLLVAGAGVLTWSGLPSVHDIVGPLAIIGACIAWGLDNNLTRKVSLADPLQIVELKGLIAGPVNLVIGLSLGATVPALLPALLVVLVGFIGYGISLALFVVALRHLGTARTGAYFSTAPFMGAALAVAVLGEPVTMQLVVAGALMALGVWLHLSEHHEHEHLHEPMSHTHRHIHDEHHRHSHSPSDPPGEPHSHAHEHGRLKHSHAHVPDAHHRHRHGAS